MMTLNACLNRLLEWKQQQLIRPLDYQFALLLADYQPQQPALLLLAALVSRELGAGNVCLPLAQLQHTDYWPEALQADMCALAGMDWQADGRLLGTGSTPSLLVLDQQRIYLYRYWRYETFVAQALQQRTGDVGCQETLLQQGLARLFPATDQHPDWQQLAAALALQKSFAVISGGPGTGKTTTVIKVLALYIEQQLASGRQPLIQLAAPTGKAAARLSESISQAKQRLQLPDELARHIPEQAGTLHRMLGVRAGSIEFRHNAANPLHLDLLLVDEASMVDLPMFARLLQALPEGTRLILLGDRDQLASVEAGSVLGDICSWHGTPAYSADLTARLNQLCQLETQPLQPATGLQPVIADCLVELQHSYRFSADSGIGRLARAVNRGEGPAVKALLPVPQDDLQFCPLDETAYQRLLDQVAEFHASLISEQGVSGPGEYLQRLTGLQLLCALREGPYGVSGLNQRVKERLVARGLVRGESLWYRGRPVMISRNDARLGLFNGDIGVAWPDQEGRLKVWFLMVEGVQGLLPSRLPEHDTVYAMTVHKSQGSEFDHALLLLPPEENPLLTRELLYTGITRAKKKLTLLAGERSVYQAVARKVERLGGLQERLWSVTEPLTGNR